MWFWLSLTKVSLYVISHWLFARFHSEVVYTFTSKDEDPTWHSPWSNIQRYFLTINTNLKFLSNFSESSFLIVLNYYIIHFLFTGWSSWPTACFWFSTLTWSSLNGYHQSYILYWKRHSSPKLIFKSKNLRWNDTNLMIIYSTTLLYNHLLWHTCWLQLTKSHGMMTSTTND